MKLFYANPHSGECLDDPHAEYSFSQVARFLSGFTRPRVSLITTTRSGLGLNFQSKEGGGIGIKFYGDKFQVTSVDLPTAKKILQRAYKAKSAVPARQLFSDCVKE